MVALLVPITLMAQYADHRGRYVDSLETVLVSPNPPKGVALLEIYRNLMWGCIQTDGKKTIDYAHKVLALSYQLDNLDARFDALRMIGQMAYGGNDYDTALNYYGQALAVVDSMRSDKRYTEKELDNNLSMLYGSIANVYNIQDEALLAIDYYQKALPIFEKNNWLESQTILYHNIGELYLSMGNTEEAKRNFLLAIEKGTASGDSLMMAMPQYGLSIIYIEQDNYAKASEAINKSYSYYVNHRDQEPQGYLQALAGMTKMHLMEGHVDLPQAERCVAEALELLDEEIDAETLSDVYSVAAMVAMEKHAWQQAAGYVQQAIDADPHETYNDMGNYAQLAEIYAQLGQKDLAAEYIQKLNNGMKRFATEHYQSGISQMEVKYQTLQKEAEITQLKKEKQWLIWGAILAGMILLLLLVLFFFVERWRKLRHQHKEVLVRIDAETMERERIGRDLHDRMGALLTGIKLNLEVFAKNHQDTIAKDNALKLTDEAVLEMRNVAHHLMPDSLKRYGLRTAISNFCQSVPTVNFIFLGKEHRLDKHEEEAIYYMVHELVNNAAKNAKAKHIYVQLIMDDSYTAINVSDDGQGLPEQTKSLKFGMQSIEERVKAINGHISIYSKPNEGTEVNIEIKA